MTDLIKRISRDSGGYALEDHGAIYIPIVMADEPGHGEGGRFLDSLPLDRTIKFPCVISPTLAGMLYRRGFSRTWEWAEEFGEVVEVFVRWAARKPTRELVAA